MMSFEREHSVLTSFIVRAVSPGDFSIKTVFKRENEKNQNLNN